jgi:hypothetical protein
MAAMAQNAQKYVNHNYSWDYITNETLKLYKTLLSPSNFELETNKGLAECGFKE